MAKREEVLQQVLASDALPTLSMVASKLISISSQEEATIQEIAELISKDISLSAKILKVVNSAFYSFPQRIGSIQQAASILGLNALRNLALTFSFLRVAREDQRRTSFDLQSFWERSLAGGVAAKLLVTQLREEDIEEVFVAGLLQNVGEMILARLYPEAYHKAQQAVHQEERSQLEAENEYIGADHVFIGGEVLKHWDFPPVLWQPVACHEDPEAAEIRDPHLLQNAHVVHLGGLLADVIYCDSPERDLQAFRRRCQELLGLSAGAVAEVVESVDNEIKAAADYFGFRINPPKSVEEVLEEANAGLSFLNLSYEQLNRELVRKTQELNRLTRELEKKNLYLEKQAYIDGLTDVYNHRFFQNYLDKKILQARKANFPLSLIMSDVDLFKRFNDTYGHQVGDQVLQEVCRIIQGQLSKQEIIARYGGEEFTLVLPGTGLEGARELAEELRERLERYELKIEGHIYRITMSFGVSTLPLEGDFSKGELIEQADQALLEAKKRGRNRVRVYGQKRRRFLGLPLGG